MSSFSIVDFPAPFSPTCRKHEHECECAWRAQREGGGGAWVVPALQPTNSKELEELETDLALKFGQKVLFTCYFPRLYLPSEEKEISLKPSSNPLSFSLCSCFDVS